MLIAAALVTPTFASAARSPQTVGGEYIVVYREDVERPGNRTDQLERDNRFSSRLRYRSALKGFAAKLSEAQVDKLRREPDVALVAPDRIATASTPVALAPGEDVPAGVRRIAAATATTARAPATGAVAVIDSGVDLAHPDLNVADGVNCVGSGPAQDANGHGTHVAGTIGARNSGAGVVGVAPGTRLYAVKVLDADGSGTFSQIICGIDWVTATRTDADPANDIRIANMSLGGPGGPVGACATTTDPMHKAICRATAAGITFVVAAGNDGWDFDYPDVPDLPAAYPEVLTVTAMSDSDGRPGGAGGAPACAPGEADDRFAGFSNYASTSAGAAHTIAAPGVCVLSTAIGGGHALMSGTSMATPHLAGAVALCLGEGGGAGPCTGLTPAQIVSKLRADAATYNNATTGYGFAGDPLRAFSGVYFGHLAFSGGDSTAPTVGAVGPVDGATAVAKSAAVTVAFGEPMNQASAQAAFSLVRASDGVAVSGTFSWSANTMTFRPSALADATSYRARVAPSAYDVAGNRLAAERTWSFKTALVTAVAPGSFTLEAGSLTGGAASALGADDGSFLQVASTTSGTRTSSWYGRFTSVARDLRGLRVTYSGRNSASCWQTVAVWRWTNSSWVQLDARNVSTTELLVDRAASGTLADYVSSGGEVRVRIRCTSSSASFVASGDLLRLSVSRA